MFSNLVKANYEIKDVSLLSLRSRIIQENSLTPLDILKGFHEKSNIDLKYNSGLTEQNKKDANEIEEEYKRYIQVEIGKVIQGMYDAEFNLAFEDCKKHCSRITLNDIIEYKNNKDKTTPVDIQNAYYYFTRSMSDPSDLLRRRVEKAAKEYIVSYIKKTFGDIYKINLASWFNNFVGLPHQLDTNNPIDIDFSEIYECFNDNAGSFSPAIIELDYDTHLGRSGTLRLYKSDIINVFVHLPESKAKELFDNAVNSVIYQNNAVGEMEYLQNLETQQITININTKTNKYELIDGYKRLLYITNEDLLKYSAPVKFFTDLNDSQFLALLYAANIWKTKERFHDRGFLFALKTRFGFVIPLSTYKNKSYSSDELATLQLYDFGGNLVRVSETKMMNTLHHHKHLVNDMTLMYNFLPQITEKQTYDKNLSDEVMFTIIEVAGDLRRAKGSDSNDLTEELITSIFEDDLIKKSCAKKHLSSRTYVINYFRDKGLYRHIIEMIEKELVND